MQIGRENGKTEPEKLRSEHIFLSFSRAGRPPSNFAARQLQYLLILRAIHIFRLSAHFDKSVKEQETTETFDEMRWTKNSDSS